MIPPVMIVDYINLFDIYPRSAKDEAKMKEVCAQVKSKFNELNPSYSLAVECVEADCYISAQTFL